MQLEGEKEKALEDLMTLRQEVCTGNSWLWRVDLYCVYYIQYILAYSTALLTATLIYVVVQ